MNHLPHPALGEPPLPAGTPLAGFILEDRVAVGPHGSLYRARRREGGLGVVGVKLIHPALTTDRDFVATFYREAKATSGLGPHPNLIPLIDYGEDAGHFYYVSELSAGRPLEAYLAGGHTFLESDCLAIARGVARALAFLHEQGRLHGAVKPGNVFIENDGRIRVGDACLARAMPRPGVGPRAGDPPSTAWYAAPELGSVLTQPDLRSDLYSLGCLLFHTITGRPPFPGDTAAAVLARHDTAPRPVAADERPTIEAAFSALIAALMSRDPAQRPQSARDVLSRLDHAEAVAPVTTLPVRPFAADAPAPLPVAGTTMPTPQPMPAPFAPRDAEEPLEKPEPSLLRPGEGDDRAPVHRIVFYAGTLLLVAIAAGVALWFTNNPLHQTGQAPTERDLSPPSLQPDPEPEPPTAALPLPADASRDDSSPFVLGEVAEQKVIATFEQRRRSALDGDAKLMVPWVGTAPGAEWQGDEATPETRNAFTATRSLWIPAAANLPPQTAPLLADARLRYTLAAGLRAARLVIVFSEVTEPGELQVLRTTRDRQVISSEAPVATRMLVRSGVQEVVLDITAQLRRDLGDNLSGGMLVRYTGRGRARIGLAWTPAGQAAGLPRISAEMELPIKLIQSERLDETLSK